MDLAFDIFAWIVIGFIGLVFAAMAVLLVLARMGKIKLRPQNAAHSGGWSDGSYSGHGNSGSSNCNAGWSDSGGGCSDGGGGGGGD